MSLFNELKRRNVIRVAMAYVVAAWLIIQVVETILPAFGYSDVAIRYIVIVLAILFIPILVFSWAFEVTPEGLKREVDVVREHSISRFTGKKIDRIIMVMLALALGYFAFDKFLLDPVEDVQIAESAHQEGRSEALIESYGDKSIAVLPFVNMSSDPEQEYFSDGLTDTLIHGLAQVSGLRVTAKTSSFYFKGMNVDIREIARKLNVSTILEGSVQKSGNRVRITAQLIEAHSDMHLWSKNFDRELEDIFAVQDEIAQEVVRALEVTLLDTEEKRLSQRYQPTLEAYEQLILGRHELGKRTAESLSAAEQHFKQAIEMDPGYALPYVYLADTYGHHLVYGGQVFEEMLRRRQPLINKAMELDPLSGEAHIARAYLHFHQQIKTGEEPSITVEEDILRALELSPNYAVAHLQYSDLLRSQGRLEEALAQVRLAAELDPMSPTIQKDIARITWNAGRTEEAMTLIRRNIERTPEFSDNYSLMATYQSALGQVGKAQRLLREAHRRNSEGSWAWNRECLGFINLGDPLSAEDCIKQFGEAHPEKVLSLILPYPLHVYRGEWNAAIATLEPLRERLSGWRAYDRLLAHSIAGQGDVERARRLMIDAFPELLENGLELVASDLNAAMVLAAILHANGETQQRDVLFLAMERQIATMHRIRGTGFGILDVYIHAMRGDRDQAIASLREAIDVGWRASDPALDGTWWTLHQDWRLASLHQDPEFIAMVDELEADINAQRQWFEENKDKPLF
jgi:TolB-like protein/Flp pilus assembly protein TadD